MKIIISIEIKRTTPSKKKSPAPQKPAAQSNSNTINIVNHK